MDIKQYQGAIFDLDGVLVDTAKYHYLAWKQLADELGFDFTRQQNEALKGYPECVLWSFCWDSEG